MVGRRLLIACAAILTAACAREVASPTPSELNEDPTTAPGHPCSWFTAAEISTRVGVPVRAGAMAGPLGTSCQWNGLDQSARIEIQVIRSVSFWSVPTEGLGLSRLAGIGKDAYVIEHQGGWKAAGLLESAFVQVLVSGIEQGKQVAERLLVDTLPRVR